MGEIVSMEINKVMGKGCQPWQFIFNSKNIIGPSVTVN